MREYRKIWEKALADAIQNAREKVKSISGSLRLNIGEIQFLSYDHPDFCGIDELPELPVSKKIDSVPITVNIIVGFAINRP